MRICDKAARLLEVIPTVPPIVLSLRAPGLWVVGIGTIVMATVLFFPPIKQCG